MERDPWRHGVDAHAYKLSSKSGEGHRGNLSAACSCWQRLDFFQYAHLKSPSPYGHLLSTHHSGPVGIWAGMSDEHICLGLSQVSVGSHASQMSIDGEQDAPQAYVPYVPPAQRPQRHFAEFFLASRLKDEAHRAATSRRFWGEACSRHWSAVLHPPTGALRRAATAALLRDGGNCVLRGHATEQSRSPSPLTPRHLSVCVLCLQQVWSRVPTTDALEELWWVDAQQAWPVWQMAQVSTCKRVQITVSRSSPSMDAHAAITPKSGNCGPLQSLPVDAGLGHHGAVLK